MCAGPQSVIRALTWNIFHGLDKPPDSRLLTWRSRLFRVTETDATHAQVNRPLLSEFAALLAGHQWDIALLQEAPSHWLPALGRGAGARGAASALTARNIGAPLRAWLANHNPDLIGAREGGSNQLLVRAPWRIVETWRVTLTRRPERRRMLLARIRAADGRSVSVANMHLTAHDSAKAGREAVLAAEHAIAWARNDPLVFGGDLNAPDSYTELNDRFEFEPRPEPQTIQYMFGRGLEVLEPPTELPSTARELPGPRGRRLRLSDHPMIVARFGLPE
jgi:endonuclease/exonuclease/phosphatase family metal-dependent hydrolase